MKNSDQFKVFSKILTPLKNSNKANRLRKNKAAVQHAQDDFSLLKNFLHELEFHQKNSLRMYNREVI